MGIAERKIRQKEEVKASILQAAWALVEKEGWQSLSIRKIADAIEYSSPVIYDHFANKEAILLEFTRRGFRQLNEQLVAAKDKFTNPEQQIEAIAYAYWKFAFNQKEYYQLMYGLGMPGCDAVKQIPELTSFTETVSAPIKEMIAKSNNAGADSFLKLHTFWSTLHGLVSINMMGKNNDHKDELNAMVLKDFLIGFVSGIKS
ncbi:MAG: TetR/AcrR family transcriptional regulator [Bacteroidetes bacterium]|jgi:AcrR family transcriptional regulator|nr:MAG: TetR/AcrR family transcriptional regulator [Bacteroidota bacterium]